MLYSKKNFCLTNFINEISLSVENAKQLRNVKQARRKSDQKNIPLWLSETSSAYGGGSQNLTDTFANGFLLVCWILIANAFINGIC